jgi:hypothetical protein
MTSKKESGQCQLFTDLHFTILQFNVPMRQKKIPGWPGIHCFHSFAFISLASGLRNPKQVGSVMD